MDESFAANYDESTADFTYGDGCPDFDWSHISHIYPDDNGVKRLENVTDKGDSNATLVPPHNDLHSLNED